MDLEFLSLIYQYTLAAYVFVPFFGRKIIQQLNLEQYQYQYTLAVYIFVPSVFRKIFQQLNLEQYRQKMLAET